MCERSALTPSRHAPVNQLRISCERGIWPDTQALARASLDGLPADEIRKLTWQNASELFRHPVPEELQVP